MEEQMKKFDQINRDLNNELTSCVDKVLRIKRVVDRLEGGIPESIDEVNIKAEPFAIIDQQITIIQRLAEINSELEGIASRLNGIA